MEAIAFAIGLEPILTRGHRLVADFHTWRHNIRHGLELCDAFTSFESDLATCMTRLRTEAEKLPEQSRIVIESDVAGLTGYLRSAKAALQSINRRLSRNRVMQFVRANAVSQDCDRLSAELFEARKLLREAIKHVDVRSAIQENTAEHVQGPIDDFRTSFPPLSSGVRAVLDFDSRDDSGFPTTTEGLVKQCVLEEVVGVPNVVAVHGIGGVGKSTIIAALARDHQIRTRFPDGVHVIKLNEVATKGTLFQRVCQVLKASGAERTEQALRAVNDIDEALQVFESWFDGKRCAFFVDDAWVHGIGIGLFSRLCCSICRTGKGNAILISTREHEIASLAPSDKILALKPRARRGQKSRQILFFHADHLDTNCGKDSLETTITKILDICAGLPVSLAAAGKSVKKLKMDMPGCEEMAWKRYLSQLVICRDNLLRKDVDNSGNLLASFATSIAFLDQKTPKETLGFDAKLPFGEMHRRFCVLEKQYLVSANLLKRLWKVESDEHAEFIATTFIERGLASSEIVQMGADNAWRLSLHDSLHDFATLESDRRHETEQTHDDLLKSYRSRDSDLSLTSEGTKWWSCELETDGYIHRNLCRHLLGARLGAELLKLLMMPQWLARQLDVNDILVLESDFAIGIKAVRNGMTEVTDEKCSEVEDALQLISEAANLSSTFFVRNFKELSFQLHGRLKQSASRYKYIREYIGRIEKDGEGPSLRSINSFLVQPGDANTRIVSVGIPMLCMQVVDHGERVVCGCFDGRIVIVDVVRREVEVGWKAFDKQVWSIAIERGGTRLISGSEADNAKEWDIETQRLVSTFNNDSNGVHYFAFMEDEDHVVSGSDDGVVQFWHRNTGRVVSQSFTGCENAIRCVAVLPDREHVVTGGGDNFLRLWSATSGTQIGEVFNGHEDEVSCVAAALSGNRIVSGSWDGTVRVWNVETHEQVGKTLDGHTDWVTCIAISHDGNRIVSGSDDKTLRVWDARTGKKICDPLEGHSSSVRGVAFQRGDNSIVSCSWDGTVRVWDVRRKKVKDAECSHKDAVTSVCFTPEAKQVVSGSKDGTLRIWDAGSGRQVGRPLEGHTKWVLEVATTPDGRRAVSVSGDKTVRVWDLQSHELLQTLTGHQRLARCVAVSPNGELAVTGSYDRTVRVWDLVALGDTHVSLEGHKSTVQRVFVLEDGMRAVSVGLNGEVFVWDLEIRQPIKQVIAEDLRELSRKQIMELIGEPTLQEDVGLSIPLQGREITYGEGDGAQILATLEADIAAWALSPDKQTLCVGLCTGQLAFMNLNLLNVDCAIL